MHIISGWIILSMIRSWRFNLRKLFALILLTFCISNLTWCKTTNQKDNIFLLDTKKFHFGIGVTATTGNLSGLIDNVRLLYNNQVYDYPGWTAEQKEVISKLDSQTVRGLVFANILCSMEYGIRTRFMYHVFISDIDLVFLPSDSSTNGRFDFQLIPTIGVRVPWLLMPYITAGPSFTFSFYPDKISDADNWKTKAGYGVFNNFVFRPGLNIRTGLDLNLRRMTIGVFYEYGIKDFAEFSDYYRSLIINGYSVNDAVWRVFNYQGRFGASIVVNLT
jgi:hypothetical protein